MRGTERASAIGRPRAAAALACAGALVCAGLAACAPPSSALSPAEQQGFVEAEPQAARQRPVVTRGPAIVKNLNAPWSIAFLPDGSALVSERDSGRILRVVPDGRETVQAEPVGRVDGVVPGGEGGLLGLAVPPGPAPAEIYAYLTARADNRVVALAWDGQRLGAQRVVIDGIPKSSIHNGGRIAFGPDGMLYVATGDAGNRDNAQRKRSLSGKVLRITTAGRPARGNPFRSSPVWTFGHRNVQGLAFDSAGRLLASEFGEKDVDELNVLKAGRNYGWPVVEGRGGGGKFTNPIVQWSPTSTASPSGIAVLGGYVYVASLRGEVLWQVPLRGSGAGKATALDIGDLGRLRDVVVAPDRSLWLLTNNTDGRGDPREGDDAIWRLSVG